MYYSIMKKRHISWEMHLLSDILFNAPLLFQP